MLQRTRVLGVIGGACLVAAVACSGSDDPAGGGGPTASSSASSASSSGGSSSSGATSSSGSSASSTSGGPSAACSGKTALSGKVDVQVSVGGQTRVGHLHVPPGYAPTRATPLVVNFHGYTDDGAKQDALSKMNAKSDAAGFLAVEPDGIDNSWNAGACCGNAVSKKVDDVAFVAKLLDAIQDKACVDPKRIFATGMSNGGFLSHRLGCEMADRFAAIAPVAGVMGVSTCNPTRRMPVMEFHGTSDPVVPYGGNAFINYPSVDTTIKGWADRGGCATTTKEIFRKGDAHCVTYDGCKDGVEVTLCTIDGGGHTWPGGTGGVGKISTDLSATDAMWDFFQKHPLP